MSNASVVESLKKVLANTYSLYLKTQNYHWNVQGMNFQALHQMFEDQYNELFIAMDDLAERIRAVREIVPNHSELIKSYGVLHDSNPSKNDREMVKDLASDHETLISLLRELSAAASEVNDEVSEGIAIDRLTVHEKTLWMLKATAT